MGTVCCWCYFGGRTTLRLLAVMIGGGVMPLTKTGRAVGREKGSVFWKGDQLYLKEDFSSIKKNAALALALLKAQAWRCGSRIQHPTWEKGSHEWREGGSDWIGAKERFRARVSEGPGHYLSRWRVSWFRWKMVWLQYVEYLKRQCLLPGEMNAENN